MSGKDGRPTLTFAYCRYFVDRAEQSALLSPSESSYSRFWSISSKNAVASDLQRANHMKTEIEDQRSGYEYVRTLIEERKRLLADLCLNDPQACPATDYHRSCIRSLEQSIRDLEALIESGSGTNN